MLRRVIAPLLLLSLALVAATPTPGPGTARLEPLLPVNPDAIAEMYTDPVVQAPNGSRRFAGQFVLVANRTFQTVSLRSIDKDVALISEDPPDRRGERMILARVPDQDLDGVVAALRSAPGIMAAGKNDILRGHRPRGTKPRVAQRRQDMIDNSP